MQFIDLKIIFTSKGRIIVCLLLRTEIHFCFCKLFVGFNFQFVTRKVTRYSGQ